MTEPDSSFRPGDLPSAAKERCEPQSVWESIVAGTLPEEAAMAHLHHASKCRECSDLLAAASACADTEPTLEEEAILQQLATNSTAGQFRLAERLHEQAAPHIERRESTPTVSEPETEAQTSISEISSTPGGRRKSLLSGFKFGFPQWALAAGVLALLIAAVLFRHSNRDSLASTNQLLAQAYGEQRTLELRIPGAAYGPLRVSRGGSGSHSDRPIWLLKAETQIALERAKNGNNAGWLVAAARADLIEGNYDSAVHSLRQAEALEPDAAEVRLDLATAYFELAKQTHDGQGLGVAVETVSHVLEKDPNNAVALFNRAAIYEHIYMYSEAAKDWRHYIQVDPHGEWSREAQEHLADVEEKIKRKQTSSMQELFAPKALAENGEHLVSDESIDLRIEEYQRAVLTKWLPDLLKQEATHKEMSAPDLRKAIQRIASISMARHNDRLLRDIVGSKSPDNVQLAGPSATLASAISANEAGDEKHASDLARNAEMGYYHSENIAGSLRSRFESLYAMQFSSQVHRCTIDADTLATRSFQEHYAWLEAQALIEKGFCSNMSGDLATASRALQRAASIAREAHYEEAENRALVGNAVMQLQAGSTSSAWDLALEGLRHYWISSMSDLRGISLYNLLDLMAEQQEQWHLQKSLIDESLPLLNRGQDHLSEAQTLFRLAGCELMLNLPDLAHTSLLEALTLFRSAPQTSATRSQESIVSINLAKAEMQSHQYSVSLARLQSLLTQVDDLHENLSVLDFFSTLGEVCRKMSKREEAEAADLKAIGLFRRSLDTLSQPRDRLAWYREVSPAYRSLVQLKLDENKISEALAIWESYRAVTMDVHKDTIIGEKMRSPEKRDSQQDESKIDSKAARAISEPVILSYANLPDGLFAWAQSGKQIALQRVATSDTDLIRLETIFANDCSTPSSNPGDIEIVGQRLFHSLLKPFQGFLLNHETIIVEPDDDIALVPFNAMVDDDGQYVNSSHGIVMSPLSSGHRSPGPRSFSITRQDRPFLIGIRSANDHSKVDDSFADEEIKNIASMFDHPTIFHPHEDPKLEFGELLSHTTLFHYAGHSGTNYKEGMLFLEGYDQTGHAHLVSLRSDDIESRWFHHCKLAVLSACQTDRGQAGHWLDRDNFAVTLLSAGVPHVVASRWDVDSNATAGLMKTFYSELLHGANTSDALHTASEVTRLTKGYSHPYYWAAFSLLEEN